MEIRGGGVGIFFFALFLLCVGGDAESPTTTTTTQMTPAVRDPREICAAEEFNPKCSDSEVIVITEARYGRMQVGECVKTDYGYVGCQSDVIDLMDDICSGRRNCSLIVPDSRLEDVNVCPKEFKAYLNASYECLPVEKSACGGCNPLTKSSVAKVTQPRGFIGSVATLESRLGVCGSAQCPWHIEVQSGQRINLTLYDFSNKKSSSSAMSPGQCIRLAVIKEAAQLKETPICYQQHRAQAIYSSVSHSVQINVVSQQVLRTKGPFLIEYEVVGCPDLHLPENAWMKRSGETVIVGCNDAAHSLRWESRCVNSRWEGEIGTCPGHSLQPTSAPSLLALPLGVLVAIVLGIALVIGVLIVTVGVVCLKRQQNEVLARSGNVLYVPAGQCYELREDFTPGHSSTITRKSTCTSDRGSVSCSGGGGGSMGSAYPKERHLVLGRRNVYAHAHMESRPLPSIPNLSEASSESVPFATAAGAVVVATGGRGAGPCRGGLRVELATAGEASSSCPYHLQSSTLGRTSHRSTPCGKARADMGCRGHGEAMQRVVAHIPMAAAAPIASSSAAAAAAACYPCAATPIAIPQHYTVLDPIEVQHQQQQLRAMMPRAVTGGAGPAQDAAGATAGGPAGSSRAAPGGPGPSTSSVPPPKPPLLPSMTVCEGARRGGDDGIEKSSKGEITLRPTRQGSSRSKTTDTGNSSWP